MAKRLLTLLLCALLSSAGAFSGETISNGNASKPDKAWPWVLGFYYSSVLADAYTTEAGLERGAKEMNPIMRQIDEDHIAPIAVALGIGTAVGLNALHKRAPRTTKGVTIGMALLHVLYATRNHDVCRPSCE